MKNIFKKLFIYLNIYSLVLVSSAHAEDVRTKRISNFLIKELSAEIEINGADFYPDRYFSAIDIAVPNESKKKHEELIANISDETQDLDILKDELIASISNQIQAQIEEMNYVMSRMDSSKLDQMFDKSMEMGIYSPEMESYYAIAFTHDEKKSVLLGMLKTDLERSKISQIKRISQATRDQLKKEVELSQSLYESKNREFKRTAAIILAVVAAGLATWAMTAIIKNHFEKKTREMNNDFDQAETDSEKEYAQKTEDLIASYEERERLREEGYVWQICAETTSQVTTHCQFDHSGHSGTEVCTTRCLKNSVTGDEVMHQKNCSSAFIPSNCYIQNEYDRGFDNGYDDGYDEAYTRAYNSAYNEAYSRYYNEYYDRGYSRGYDWGYNAGFSDGYDRAVYDDSLDDDDDSDDGGWKSNKDTNLEGFSKGYKDGYRYAQKLKLGLL